MTLYCFNFNNYANRIVRGPGITTIDAFIEEFGYYQYLQSDTYGNFAEKDGLVTEQVLGNQNNAYFNDCDYIVVCDDNQNITSRWFIMDSIQLCYGQYKCSLKRDVLAENWSSIINAPAYVERGIVNDDSPFIFNQEPITTNQIKISEALLRDESKMGWLVGYLYKEYSNSEDINIPIDAIPDYNIPTLNDIASTVGHSFNTEYYQLNNYSFKFVLYGYYSAIQDYYKTSFTVNSSNGQFNVSAYSEQAYPPSGGWVYNGTPSDLQTAVENTLNYYNITYAITHNARYATTIYNKINSNNNKIMYLAYANEYAKIETHVSIANHDRTTNSAYSNVLSIILDNINTITHTGNNLTTITDFITNDDTIYATYATIAFGNAKVNFGTATDRIHCKEVFDLFCIPYPVTGDCVVQNTSDSSWPGMVFTKEIALNIASGIATKLGSNLYDLQLLPYCPLTGILFSQVGEHFYMDIKTTDTKRYKLVTNDNDVAKCLVLFSASNKGTKNITSSILPPTNKKLNNQTQKLRLVSPNYSGSFDFNQSKNLEARLYNVDFTYLPYRPYIHVAPVWNSGGIYGPDLDGARGLICGGDFTVNYMNDAWVQYQIQNKNYDNIFDRQTQTLETNHKYQRISNIISAATGAAGTGAMVGNIFNAGAGAAAGLLSAAGGVGDILINEKLYKEQMDSRKDIYEMQLDNIQALPQSLTKVTAINNNNRVFPFIEIYDCTEVERVAVANYIRQKSMTVGVIDTFNTYIQNSWSYNDITDRGYIQGYVIDLDIADPHMMNVINEELKQGVYTK